LLHVHSGWWRFCFVVAFFLCHHRFSPANFFPLFGAILGGPRNGLEAWPRFGWNGRKGFALVVDIDGPAKAEGIVELPLGLANLFKLQLRFQIDFQRFGGLDPERANVLNERPNFLDQFV
jgi:hypothetical protein